MEKKNNKPQDRHGQDYCEATNTEVTCCVSEVDYLNSSILLSMNSQIKELNADRNYVFH